MSSIIKRLGQFFRALYLKMEAEDYRLVKEYLNQVETELFFQTDPAIQKHCVNVARTVISLYPEHGRERDLLVRTSLLHDIGKTRGSFGLSHRVLYVLIKRLSPRLAAAIATNEAQGYFRRFRQAFYVHLYHEKIGSEILRKKGLPEQMVFWVANHHNSRAADSSEQLARLIKADELN